MSSGRRRPGKRRSRARSRLGLLLAVCLLLAVVVVVVVALNRQIRGYFTIPSAPHSPQATPTAPAFLQPSPIVATPIAGTGPRVAIIIDDCGYNVKRCEQFLALPIPITLSILPMTPHAKQLAAEALAAGKSVMLHLPMEPDAPTAHPGPGAIMTAMSDAQVQAQVEADIASVPDAPGANNHMGSKATSDPRVMRDVLLVFREHHLFFIDSMTSYYSVGEATAHGLGIPTAKRDVFLDDSHDLPYIQGQFAELQRVVLKQGTAIAIGHPFDTTAQALKAQIPKFEDAGITFVPAQTLVR
ncbi:MAG TPA: divergent polysaccharide deacetylase family protein [Candidatus Acidoferrales bacterium]|nr:divergent polysaccharide deacetylase family protein [Candidatus Acidoferrales bacterium]